MSRSKLLALAIAASLFAVAGCTRSPSPQADAGSSTVPADENADAFIARVNREMRTHLEELSAAQWVSSTYITSDSELLAAKANERWLTALNGWIEQARRYEGQTTSPATARALTLLKLMTAMPAPRDPAKLAELARIASKMEGMYGSGQYCTGEGDARKCRQLGELEDVLRTSRDYNEQLDAWKGWHTISPPMNRSAPSSSASYCDTSTGVRNCTSTPSPTLWC